MAEFLKIQRKLEEIAIKIEDGNITASISSKGELTMEFAIKLKKSDQSITDKLYCKITCSTENNLDNKSVYDETYTLLEEDVYNIVIIGFGIVLGVVAIIVAPKLIPLILAAALKVVPRVAG